VKHNHPP
jgi:hypothetical protein